MEPGGLALLAGDASVDSWFREIHVPQAWHVYLTTGLDFREKNRTCFRSIGARVCCKSPTLPLYYEGKMMKTIFLFFYEYVLRTTTTRHMVSFIDFYFHFLANFQTWTSPHMFSIFTYIMSRVTHSEPGLPMEPLGKGLNEPEKPVRRAQNIFMPKNINSITINITLEGIEKIKRQQNSLNNNASIYKLNGFYFSLNENTQ